jgi:hypothetical protein
VVEGGVLGVKEGVVQLSALVERPRCRRGQVAGDAAGEGELPEEALNAGCVTADRRVPLAVGALQPGAGVRTRPTVPVT